MGLVQSIASGFVEGLLVLSAPVWGFLQLICDSKSVFVSLRVRPVMDFNPSLQPPV